MLRRAALFLLSSLFAGAGCLSRPIEPNEPQTTQTFTDSSIASIERIDLLLAIDNSASMGDKQAILADAVPALVRGLLSPNCLDDSGKALPADQQPTSPLAPCPARSAREFTPIVDVHVGIVSSTLDSQCDETGVKTPPTDDGGRLVARSIDGSPFTPDDSKPFLDWDPKQEATPPGESVLSTFEDHVRVLVKGVNQNGCGYEAQLESWYRFLVEPAPDDQRLIDERNEFLRPDSLVAIVLLSDENDCSVKRDSKSQKVLEVATPQTRGRAICATKPDDPCCTPCGQEPKDCPVDATCENPTLSAAEDPYNLRCWDQKRRFGYDSLFPVQRYIDGLTKATVIDSHGNESDNPLFPGPKKGPLGRTTVSQLVYFAGIVGVPWQDIARKNAAKMPDLKQGLDSSGAAVGGFLNADEMNVKSGSWGSTWDLVLGDPDHRIKPQDTLMLESEAPRKGENPILDAALAPATATSATANPINGHEWNAASEDGSDLQYACIFNLPKPFDIDDSNCADDTACVCNPALDNPLCQATDGTYSTSQQFRAKAYPGIRQLQVLKGIGQQGIVGSICPAQLDTQGPDYGYQPAVGAIVDRLKSRLANDCLPLKLEPDKDGSFPCIVLEAHLTSEGCACDSLGRKPATSKSALDAKAQVETQGDFACFCEIDELEGHERDVCQTDPGASPAVGDKSIDGWCYVDPINGEGSFDVVKSCPESEKRELRFVNGGKAEPKTATFITCVQ